MEVERKREACAASAYAPVPAGPGGSAAATRVGVRAATARLAGSTRCPPGRSATWRLRVPAARLSTAGRRAPLHVCGVQSISVFKLRPHGARAPVAGQGNPRRCQCRRWRRACGGRSLYQRQCVSALLQRPCKRRWCSSRDVIGRRIVLWAARPQGEQDVGLGSVVATAAVSAVVGRCGRRCTRCERIPRSRRHRGRRTRDTGGMATVGAGLVPQAAAGESVAKQWSRTEAAPAMHRTADEYEAFGRRISAAETGNLGSASCAAGARGVGASLLRVRPVPEAGRTVSGRVLIVDVDVEAACGNLA